MFHFFSKTEYGFFISILIITAIIYILYLKRKELTKKHDMIIKINNGMIIVIFILIYMGRKKFEYKNNFNYLTFIFGKVECTGTISNINYSTYLKHLFR